MVWRVVLIVAVGISLTGCGSTMSKVVANARVYEGALGYQRALADQLPVGTVTVQRGDSTMPAESLQAALERAKDGDRIILSAGRFPVRNALRLPARRIVVEGQGVDSVIYCDGPVSTDGFGAPPELAFRLPTTSGKPVSGLATGTRTTFHAVRIIRMAVFTSVWEMNAIWLVDCDIYGASCGHEDAKFVQGGYLFVTTIGGRLLLDSRSIGWTTMEFPGNYASGTVAYGYGTSNLDDEDPEDWYVAEFRQNADGTYKLARSPDVAGDMKQDHYFARSGTPPGPDLPIGVEALAVPDTSDEALAEEGLITAHTLRLIAAWRAGGPMPLPPAESDAAWAAYCVELPEAGRRGEELWARYQAEQQEEERKRRAALAAEAAASRASGAAYADRKAQARAEWLASLPTYNHVIVHPYPASGRAPSVNDMWQEMTREAADAAWSQSVRSGSANDYLKWKIADSDWRRAGGR